MKPTYSDEPCQLIPKRAGKTKIRVHAAGTERYNESEVVVEVTVMEKGKGPKPYMVGATLPKTMTKGDEHTLTIKMIEKDKGTVSGTEGSNHTVTITADDADTLVLKGTITRTEEEKYYTVSKKAVYEDGTTAEATCPENTSVVKWVVNGKDYATNKVTFTVTADTEVKVVVKKIPVHVHKYDVEKVADEYKCSEATCTESAKYYKSCECGGRGETTFTVGEPLGHKFENGVCGVCGEKDPNYKPPTSENPDPENPDPENPEPPTPENPDTDEPNKPNVNQPTKPEPSNRLNRYSLQNQTKIQRQQIITM